MAEKLNPFYKILKTEVPINITSELRGTFVSVNKSLSDACELALEQTIPGKQLVLMTDASFQSAGIALMIEGNPDQKNPIKKKDLCTCRVCIKNFLLRTIKDVDLLESILGNPHGISWTCTHFVGSNKANNPSDG